MSETAESVEDRIAAHFTPEEPDVSKSVETELPEETTDEQPEAPESDVEETAQDAFEEVEFEGKQYRVPPELKDALMAKSDYTSKTQEAARLRDALTLQQKEVALHHETRAFEQSVAEDFDRLKMLDAYIKHTKENTNWAEMKTDEIVRAQLEIGQLDSQREELANALRGKQQEFAQKLEGERKKLKEEADQVLAKAIPNYKPEMKADIEKFVVGLGYPEAAIPNMRALDYQVAWEAFMYRQLQQGKAAAVQKAATAPPVIKAGATNPMPKDVREKLSFKKQMEKASKDNLPEAQKARIIQKRLEQKLGG